MANKRPLISICIPAYNAQNYIRESVNSVLQQSYENIEIIVVDDGSTDRTLEILRSYKSEKLKVIAQKNQGQCIAANRAFAESTGDLIKFFDADDLLSPDFIANQVAVMEGNENCIAKSLWGRFYNDDISTFIINKDLDFTTIAPIEWLAQSLLKGDAMMQCALWLIPRKILEKSGLWDERLSLINDFEFFIRVLLQADEIRNTPNATLFYRSGIKGSLSNTTSRKSVESAYLSILTGTSHLLECENSARIRKISADRFQHFVYTFYPDHNDLLKEAEEHIKALGGSSIKFPAGGVTKVISQVIGWKATKRLKKLHRK